MTPGRDSRENLLPVSLVPDEKKKRRRKKARKPSLTHPHPTHTFLSWLLRSVPGEDKLVMQATGNSKSILLTLKSDTVAMQRNSWDAILSNTAEYNVACILCHRCAWERQCLKMNEIDVWEWVLV